MGQQPKLMFQFVQWFGDANQLGIGVGGKTRKCTDTDTGTHRIVLTRHGIGTHYVMPVGFGYFLFDGVHVR